MEITVILERIWHQNTECLALRFKYNSEIINVLKKIPGSTWSASQRAWLLNYSPSNVNEVCKILNTQNATILFKGGKEVGRQAGFAGKQSFENLIQKGVTS